MSMSPESPLTVGEFVRAQGMQTDIIVRGFAKTDRRLEILEHEHRLTRDEHVQRIAKVETLLDERTKKHKATQRNMFTGWASAAGLLAAEAVKALWQMKHP